MVPGERPGTTSGRSRGILWGDCPEVAERAFGTPPVRILGRGPENAGFRAAPNSSLAAYFQLTRLVCTLFLPTHRKRS